MRCNLQSSFIVQTRMSTWERLCVLIAVNKSKDKPVVYRIPYTYNWSKDDEVAIFMKNYGNVLKKDDIDFWRLDIYLDKDGYCTRSEKRRLLNLFPW